MSLALSKGGNKMSVRYDRLFKLLNEKNISTRELERQGNFSGNITTRIRRNEYISLESVEKICVTLNCCVDDVLEFE